jgi:hypothetical protein
MALLRAQLIVVLICLSGCLGGASDEPTDTAADTDAVTATDAAAVTDTATATANDTATATDTEPAPAPFFDLGWNVTGSSTPDSFTPLSDGAPLDVEFGPQGLWMVVLAFRSRDLLVEPLFLDGRIDVHDHPARGELALQGQKLLPGPEGVRYYYNFWLVVDDPEGVAGKTATVSMLARDANGKEHQAVVEVLLTGGADA